MYRYTQLNLLSSSKSKNNSKFGFWWGWW